MTKQEETFVHTVWQYYARAGRHNLPWRKTKNPYRILVSEIMLQQTQVDRVIPKYAAFISRYPSWSVLAHAPLGDVLRAWQGLGYNRRAKMLHACARAVEEQYKGVLPQEYKALVALPGIGPYTAGAVMAFAWNISIPMVETNIRSAYLHHFFIDSTDVSDTEIKDLVLRTLDYTRGREWYYALMDYGSYIKKEFGNPNSKSKHYTKQSTFKGSDREIRGTIIRLLTESSCTYTVLRKKLPFSDIRIDAQLESLVREGLIVQVGRAYALP